MKGAESPEKREVDAAVLFLIAVRTRQGISQTDMARRCGWTKQYLNKIETGVIGNPGIRAIRSMAGALHLRVAFVQVVDD